MESKIAHLWDVLDHKYKPADLLEVAKSCKSLDDKQQDQLFRLLKSHKPLFDGSIGRMKSEPYDIKLKMAQSPIMQNHSRYLMLMKQSLRLRYNV